MNSRLSPSTPNLAHTAGSEKSLQSPGTPVLVDTHSYLQVISTPVGSSVQLLGTKSSCVRHAATDPAVWAKFGVDR